jgi:predicted MFS family arabinose efflux permease
MPVNRWVILAVIFLARTSVGFQFQSIASVSPLLVEDLSLDYGQVGTLIGVYMLPGMVIAIPGGFLVRRIGDKSVCSLGIGLMVVGGVVVAFAESYEIALLGRIVSGSGAMIYEVVLAKMVVDWFAHREIVSAMAVMLSAWPFGLGLAMVTQASLATTYSWELVMLVTAAMSTTSILLILALYRRPPTADSTEEHARLRLSIPMNQVVLVSIAGIVWGLMNVGFTVFFSYVPDLIAESGISAAEARSIVSVGVWSTMITVPLGGYLIQRIGWENTAVILCSLLGALVLFLFPILAAPIVLSILIAIALGPPPGAIYSLPARVLTPENRGPGLGLFQTWSRLFFAVGPALAGFSRDWTGSASAPVVFGGFAFVMVIPFFFLFHLARRRLGTAPTPG